VRRDPEGTDRHRADDRQNYDPWGGNNDDKDIDWKSIKVKAKKSSHKTAGKNKWRLNELAFGKLCGGAERGVFLVEVKSDEVQPDAGQYWQPRRNRVLANVTDMGVLIKTGVSSGLVWVTSLSTGLPIANAKVTLYTPQGKAVHTDVTNADGLVKTPGSASLKQQKPTHSEEEGEYEDWDSYRSQRMIAVVRTASTWRSSTAPVKWHPALNFGVTEDRRGASSRSRLHPERPRSLSPRRAGSLQGHRARDRDRSRAARAGEERRRRRDPGQPRPDRADAEVEALRVRRLRLRHEAR
jgi:hypothetical protein